MRSYSQCFMVEFLPNVVFEVDGGYTSIEPVSFVFGKMPNCNDVASAISREIDMESYNAASPNKGIRAASFSQVTLMLNCIPPRERNLPLIPTSDMELITRRERRIYVSPGDPESGRAGSIVVSILPIHT